MARLEDLTRGASVRGILPDALGHSQLTFGFPFLGYPAEDRNSGIPGGCDTGVRPYIGAVMIYCRT